MAEIDRRVERWVRDGVEWGRERNVSGVEERAGDDVGWPQGPRATSGSPQGLVPPLHQLPRPGWLLKRLDDYALSPVLRPPRGSISSIRCQFDAGGRELGTAVGYDA